MVKPNQFVKALPILAVFAGLLSPVQVAYAQGNPALPSFSDFISSVSNGQAGMVTGVYVPNRFAFPVVAQPANNSGYVSTQAGVVTRFGMASNFNVVGLLAHNNLAGATFSSLMVGDEIFIVFGDGHFTSYWVNHIYSYQALQPTDINSQFYDTASGKIYSAGQIFNMYYTGNDHVTLQTCIAKGSEASWGRLFVTAVPNNYATLLPSDVMNFLFKAWPILLGAGN